MLQPGLSSPLPSTLAQVPTLKGQQWALTGASVSEMASCPLFRSTSPAPSWSRTPPCPHVLTGSQRGAGHGWAQSSAASRVLAALSFPWGS